MEHKIEGKLSSRNLWGYAIGAVPNGLLVFIFGLKYIEFFYDKLQLNPTFFIIGQVIYMTINALNDPLLGQLSDRTNRKKWKSRRIIYIKYGAPIWTLTFILVWFPWSFDNQIIIFIHYVISICLYDTMMTLVVLVWLALLPEMTSDMGERNKGNLLTIFIGVITIVPFFLIIAEMDPTSSEYLIFMIAIAIISTFLLWLTAYLCEEKPEFQMDLPPPLWKAIKETVKSKTFLIYIGYIFCDAFLGSIGMSYLFAYIFILGEGGYIYYFGIYIFVGIASNLTCVKVSTKWGLRDTILRFGIIKVIGTFILFLIVLFVDISLLVVIGLAILTFFGGYTVLNTPMLYLSVDEDEVKSGSRREGMFFGVNALFHKPAQSLGPIVATILLVTFGFIQGSDVQPSSALTGIKILMFLVPVIVTTIGLTILSFHPLHGKKLEDMRENLEKLHEEKRKKIE